ncbi:hypothetical protein NW767_015448 [Fusarium falciforme]|nr:hypothetical protein NW767_015448 [Fusarium falciforme]KAJ4214527.1 hypothetical protein NW757_014729 [Fusarium falciforme]
MGELYRPLDESRDEVRLLNLLPKSRKANAVHCTMKIYSLKDFTQEHLAFLSSSSSAGLSKRNATSRWVQSRIAADLASLAPLTLLHATQPPSSQHRFTWGDYAALSYVWGDERDTATIVLNGHKRSVTANLARALTAFSREGEFEDDGTGLKLWVDAVCINQADLDERARQLRQMRDIYGGAWAVVSWLGEASFKSSSAIQLLHNLALLREHDHCGNRIDECLRTEPDFLGKGCWLALQELMDRPYWYRLWIIQEMVMGASATWIRCGTASIDWTSFCAGVAFLEEHLWLVKNDLLRDERLIAGLKTPSAWTVESLHLVYQDLSSLSEREEKGGEYPSFGKLLEIANSADCKDPRDKVYGLVGLMPPSIADRLQPDYTLPVGDVYTATAHAFIATYDNLEPLRDCNPWGPSCAPSWVADWQWDGRLRSSRAESQLWGPPRLFPRLPPDVSFQVPFRASGGSSPDASFSDDRARLSCDGFILDNITGLSARGKGYFSMDKRSIAQPKRWRSAYGDFAATAEALYRTLVMDRVAGGAKATASHAAILSLPPSFDVGGPEFARRRWSWLAGQEGYYFRWENFRTVNRDFRLGEYRLDDFFSDEIPADATESDYSEVYSCFDRSSQRRRFMTTENGYMGWAPDNIYGKAREQTQRGDLIAVLFGCSTPIVIRPRGKYFQVLGEAYVHGLMEGEAMEFLNSGKAQRQRFTFC